MPEVNGKQNPRESYINKYEKHIACSYGYKLVCADDKFSKPFKTYLGKDPVCNFINNMIEQSKYFSAVIKEHFNKEFVVFKDDYEDFKNSTKCRVCDYDYADNDAKIKDHCHITAKYRGFIHRDRNVNLKLNQKIPVVFQNLKNYDLGLII